MNLSVGHSSAWHTCRNEQGGHAGADMCLHCQRIREHDNTTTPLDGETEEEGSQNAKQLCNMFITRTQRYSVESATTLRLSFRCGAPRTDFLSMHRVSWRNRV